VDLGTNTVRLLVGERSSGGVLRVIHEAQKVTRLGQDLGSTGRIQQEAALRTLEVLEGFSTSWRECGVERVRIAATAAVRESSNGEEFARQVVEAVGVPLDVLSGEEEARLTALGVCDGLGGLPEEGVIFDIGGGSTEFISLKSYRPARVVSLPVGVVKGREAFISHDPVVPEELEALSAYLWDAIFPARSSLEAGAGQTLIGTAGTVTTLAALDLGLECYEAERVNAHVLTETAVVRLMERLASMTVEERRAFQVIEPGREDLIVAGAALTRVVLEVFGSPSLIVSEYGLREGLVLDMLAK
jgi:exopolyphosphatase/guanosine-5'-triphosphate,3'-diphosphate pyrophosphatase